MKLVKNFCKYFIFSHKTATARTHEAHKKTKQNCSLHTPPTTAVLQLNNSICNAELIRKKKFI